MTKLALRGAERREWHEHAFVVQTGEYAGYRGYVPEGTAERYTTWNDHQRDLRRYDRRRDPELAALCDAIAGAERAPLLRLLREQAAEIARLRTVVAEHEAAARHDVTGCARCEEVGRG